MNIVHTKKILGSKWTAVSPKNKEKHFIVTKCNYNEDNIVENIIIEAVFTKHEYQIQYQELRNEEKWLTGWK